MKRIAVLSLGILSIPIYSIGKSVQGNGLALGVYAGAQYTHLSFRPRVNNFKYNMYNGGELGGYASLQRSKWAFTTNLALQIVSFNYNYQHPQIANIGFDSKRLLLVVNSMFAFGLNMVERQKYKMEIAAICNFTITTNNKNITYQNAYLEYDDPTLQTTNYKTIATVVRNQAKVPFDASIGLSLAYHRKHTKNWYMRCNLIISSLDGASVVDAMTISALDASNAKLIQRIHVFDNKWTIAVSVGTRLWYRKMN